jgi:hypothetical protein
MSLTQEENERYRAFVSKLAQDLGCFNFKPDDIVWHYTNGEGFLGILQSSTIYATQISSLNDSNETKHAATLFQASIEKLIEEHQDNATARDFLHKVLEYTKDDPTFPQHGKSKFFVACFSGMED